MTENFCSKKHIAPRRRAGARFKESPRGGAGAAHEPGAAFGLRGLDLSITHNILGLGEDLPGGGDVVEALETAPEHDHAGVAVVLAA